MIARCWLDRVNGVLVTW